MEEFEKLGICSDVLRVLATKKFSKPTQIQEKSIPLILEGRDVIAGSATGSGKTLAFGSGIIKNVSKKGVVQALILTPTRELAEQVSKAIEEFSYYKELTVACVYGGVSIQNQIKRLSYADIVVATPGRLLDHMQRNSVNLKQVKFLVLDEADRMWDMGFKEDVGKIVRAVPKEKQAMLFSATISGELAEFSEKYMKNPVEVAVESYVDASKLRQIYFDVRDDEKFSLLVHLLKNETAHLIMIFCNTRRTADFVAKNLKKNDVNAQVIHGGMEQNKRTRVMKSFDSKSVNVLVCTDVAARGLDIKGVSHVYNYDITNDPRDYVHRIGRTARAGAEGIAVNLVASRDYDNFAGVQKRNPEIRITRKMTPYFKKIFVEWDAPKRREGRGFGRGLRPRGRSDGSRGQRGREDSKLRDSRGKGPLRRSRPDTRNRQVRGERNKRVGREKSLRRDSRSERDKKKSRGGFQASNRDSGNKRRRY